MEYNTEGPPTPRPCTATQPLNADTGNYDLRSPPVPSAPYNTPSNGTGARPKVPHGHAENSVYIRGQGLPTHNRYETSPMPTTTPVPILTSTERRQNGDRSATEVRQTPQQNHYQGVPPPSYHTREVSTEVAMQSTAATEHSPVPQDTIVRNANTATQDDGYQPSPEVDTLRTSRPRHDSICSDSYRQSSRRDHHNNSNRSSYVAKPKFTSIYPSFAVLLNKWFSSFFVGGGGVV